MQLDPQTPLTGGGPFGAPVAGFLQINIFLKRSGNTEYCGKRMRNEEHLKTAPSHKFLTLPLASCPVSGTKLGGERKILLLSPGFAECRVPACAAWLVRQVLCLPGHTWTGPVFK